MKWQILDSGVRSAVENMQIDADLLDNLDPAGLPILHFYDWKGDSATYGHFVNPADFLDLPKAKKRGLSLAKRPTGGGIIFHIWDLAFSLLIPAEHPYFSTSTLENYQFVNQRVLDAVQGFKKMERMQLIPEDAPALDASCMRFCMAQPTKYDLLYEGRKIAGAAQRRTKQGFLHQGTIALKMPDFSYLEEVLLPDTQVLTAMKANTFALLQPHEELQSGRLELKQYLEKSFTQDK